MCPKRGGAGKATGIGQGLNRASATVKQSACVKTGAKHGGGFGLVQQINRSTALLPLARPFGQFGHALFADTGVQRADWICFAGNGVAAHHFPNISGTGAQKIQQAVAVILPQGGDQVFGHDPHARIDQTDIAPRAAKADLCRL